MSKETPKVISAFPVECNGLYERQNPVVAAITVLDDSTRQVSCPKMGRIADETGSCQNGGVLRDRLKGCVHLNSQTEVFTHVTDD